MEETKETYYHGLFELAATLNSAHAPEAVLQCIVESVTKMTGAKGCSLMLLSPDKKELVHTTAYGLSDWYVRKGPVCADKCISEALAGKAVPLFYATEDHRVRYRNQAKKEGIASILSVPMTLREDVVGLIRVYTAERRQFTVDDMYFVGGMANLGAIALENAQLYQSVNRN